VVFRINYTEYNIKIIWFFAQ